MTWLVVLFCEDNSVEAVPKSWYVNSSNECFWPPKSCSTNKIIDAIKNKEMPNENWKPHIIKILGEYEDLKIAQKKSRKAQETSDISSQEDTIICGKRRIISNKKYDSSESDVDTEESDEVEMEYPKQSLKNITYSSDNKENDRCTEKAASAIKGQVVDNDMANAAVAEYGQELDNGPVSIDVYKQMQHELAVISAKLNVIMETTNIILKNQSLCGSDHVTFTNDDYVLPIANEEELIKIEKWLNENKENPNILAKQLSHIGGVNTKEITRKIMYKLLSNEVGVLFSWNGAKKKRPFKNLQISKVILQAVRLNAVALRTTDSEIIDFIRLWLVRAKDRIINQQQRIMKEDLGTTVTI